MRRKAREEGFVVSATGRRRAIPDLRSPNFQLRSAAERMAINFPMQSLAADIIKIAMVRLQREIEADHIEGRMLLQVHDELLFEVPRVGGRSVRREGAAHHDRRVRARDRDRGRDQGRTQLGGHEEARGRAVPELPEVETIVATCGRTSSGAPSCAASCSFPTIVRHPEPEVFIDAVAGMRIESVGRRGKYILHRRLLQS